MTVSLAWEEIAAKRGQWRRRHSPANHDDRQGSDFRVHNGFALAVLFSAALLAIALFAKSYKEAQSYISPLMIVMSSPLSPQFYRASS